MLNCNDCPVNSCMTGCNGNGKLACLISPDVQLPVSGCQAIINSPPPLTESTQLLIFFREIMHIT